MNPVIVYHANCLDGFASAYAAWLTFGDQVVYLPARYNNQDDIDTVLTHCHPNNTVFVLDFSFQLEVLQQIEEHAHCVVMVDHHKTAFEMFGVDPKADEIFTVITDKHHYYLDNARSGALLAWDWFHGDEPPLALLHIDDRDRWQFKMQGTKEFTAALWNHPRDFQVWNQLFTPEGVKQLYQEGEALLKEQACHVEACVKRARSVDLCNQAGLVVNTDKDISEVGHALCSKNGTFGLIWYIDSTGQANCSLRSSGDYDVSVIAKQFGGGGHKNAAGFKLSLDELFELLA